jgi:DNA replication and repair protein RecF
MLANDYAAAVGQRNAALRRIRAAQSTRDALAPWTRRAVTLGEELVRARTEALTLLSEPFTQSAGALGLSSATLAYEGEPVSEVELEDRLEADIDRGVTGAGPHLHDVRIEADGRDLRVFGSQGEQRVAVLSLVMAEADALRDRLGTSPLVLLDDVLSELDGERRQALAAMISRAAQTVVTATAAEALPGEPAQLLAVFPGEVR